MDGQKQLSRRPKTTAELERDLGIYACSTNTLSFPEASRMVYVDHQQNYFFHEKVCCIAQGKGAKISS
jgi:hypothetical protein